VEILGLEIERERIGQALFPTLREYASRWGLTAARRTPGFLGYAFAAVFIMLASFATQLVHAFSESCRPHEQCHD